MPGRSFDKFDRPPGKIVRMSKREFETINQYLDHLSSLSDEEKDKEIDKWNQKIKDYRTRNKDIHVPGRDEEIRFWLNSLKIMEKQSQRYHRETINEMTYRYEFLPWTLARKMEGFEAQAKKGLQLSLPPPIHDLTVLVLDLSERIKTLALHLQQNYEASLRLNGLDIPHVLMEREKQHENIMVFMESFLN